MQIELIHEFQTVRTMPETQKNATSMEIISVGSVFVTSHLLVRHVSATKEQGPLKIKKDNAFGKIDKNDELPDPHICYIFLEQFFSRVAVLEIGM